MPRITSIDPASATGKSAALFDAVNKKLGRVPNMMRTLGHSPAALEGYLSLSGVLSGGALSAKVREQIALALSERTACNYCLSAHTAIGKMAGLAPADIAAARHGEAADPKVDAILKLAIALVETEGAISDEEFNQARDAGVTDAEFAEVVANVALNVLTNFFNKAAKVENDFPAVEPAAAHV